MESRRETTVEPKYDVSVVRPSGQEKQTVIENVPLYSHLSWSPDSRFLSFVSNFEGSRGLYTWATHDASGKRFRFLSGVEAPFAWSPDSKRVAYGENIIRVVDITTEKTRILFHTSGFGGPLWLPDGNRVLMYNTLSTRRIDSDDVNLYVTRIEPQYISRLTAENLQVWDISSPPNGKVIAFTASAKGNNAASSRVYVINSDGSNERELAVPSIEPGWFAWSADGNKIAFVKEMLNCKKCRPGNLKIEVANADGSDEHTIVNQPAWNFAPAWLPDGKSVVFLSDRNNAHGVYLTDIKSKHTQLLADVSGSIPNHVRIERTDKFVPLVWSPDATKLATSSAVPRPGLIQVIDVKKPATFTFSGIAPWVLNWTPDSSRIAVADLVHGIAMNSITPTFVDLLAFDGSNRLRLMAPSTLSGALFRMAWSIDGKRFACSGITIFNADGSNQRFVVKGWNPVWVR
jgi:Tol biopolymer transport system component